MKGFIEIEQDNPDNPDDTIIRLVNVGEIVSVEFRLPKRTLQIQLTTGELFESPESYDTLKEALLYE